MQMDCTYLMMLVDLVQLHQGDVRRFCCFFFVICSRLTMNETRIFALDVFRMLFVVSDAANHSRLQSEARLLKCAPKRDDRP